MLLPWPVRRKRGRKQREDASAFLLWPGEALGSQKCHLPIVDDEGHIHCLARAQGREQLAVFLFSWIEQAVYFFIMWLSIDEQEQAEHVFSFEVRIHVDATKSYSDGEHVYSLGHLHDKKGRALGVVLKKCTHPYEPVSHDTLPPIGKRFSRHDSCPFLLPCGRYATGAFICRCAFSAPDAPDPSIG